MATRGLSAGEATVGLILERRERTGRYGYSSAALNAAPIPTTHFPKPMISALIIATVVATLDTS